MLSLTYFAIGTVETIKGLSPDEEQIVIGGDFAVYYAAGEAALEGAAHEAYNIESFRDRERKFASENLTRLDWHYPPSMFFVVLPTQLFDFLTAKVIWSLVSVVLFYFALRFAIPDNIWLILLVLISPTVIQNIVSGQNGVFIAAVALFGLTNVRTRPWLAGIMIGLLTIKPHLGLLIPIALIAGGYWRVFAYAVITTAVLVISSALIFGFDSWLAFIQNSVDGANLNEAWMQTFWFKMPTVFAGIMHLGMAQEFAWYAQGIATVSVVVLVAIAWRSTWDHRWKISILLLAGILAVPYAQFYDLAIVLPVLAWSLASLTHSTHSRFVEGLLIITYMAPVIMLLAQNETHPFMVWAVLHTIIFVLYWRGVLLPKSVKS